MQIYGHHIYSIKNLHGQQKVEQSLHIAITQQNTQYGINIRRYTPNNTSKVLRGIKGLSDNINV